MALKIKTQTESANGFKANKAFIFLDFFFLENVSTVNLTYFESQASFKARKNAYIPAGLPATLSMKINKQTFWGTQLITDIHNLVIAELEKVVGAGNVEIIQDPNV